MRPLSPTERMIGERTTRAIEEALADGKRRSSKARAALEGRYDEIVAYEARVTGQIARRLNDVGEGPVPNIRDPRWAGYGKSLDDVLVAPPSATNVPPR